MRLLFIDVTLAGKRPICVGAIQAEPALGYQSRISVLIRQQDPIAEADEQRTCIRTDDIRRWGVGSVYAASMLSAMSMQSDAIAVYGLDEQRHAIECLFADAGRWDIGEQVLAKKFHCIQKACGDFLKMDSPTIEAVYPELLEEYRSAARRYTGRVECCWEIAEALRCRKQIRRSA